MHATKQISMEIPIKKQRLLSKDAFFPQVLFEYDSLLFCVKCADGGLLGVLGASYPKPIISQVGDIQLHLPKCLQDHVAYI